MRRVGLVAWVCTAGLVALGAGCSADGSGDGSPDPAASTAAGSDPSEVDDAAAEGERTTAPGSVLDLGGTATVAWRPSAALEGVLEMSVERVRAGRPRDFTGLVASGTVEGARPYYVDVTLTNAGDSDLGGLDVALYLRDSSGTLGPPWGFTEPFAPCRSRPLPGSFAPGRTVATCLVFFARAGATYDAVAYQPRPDQEAITWTGDVTEPDRDRPSRRRR
jgi:hypothetical protein